MNTIAIEDYGMSNLRSVVKADEYGAPNQKVIISSNPKEIDNADKINFPAQGAARKCINSIFDNNLYKVIKKISSEKPFLGICMGMQVLMDYSEENNGTDCLGLIKGKVKKFQSTQKNQMKTTLMKNHQKLIFDYVKNTNIQKMKLKI